MQEHDFIKERRQKRYRQAQWLRDKAAQEQPHEEPRHNVALCPYCEVPKSSFKKFSVHLRHCRKRHGD